MALLALSAQNAGSMPCRLRVRARKVSGCISKPLSKAILKTASIAEGLAAKVAPFAKAIRPPWATKGAGNAWVWLWDATGGVKRSSIWAQNMRVKFPTIVAARK